MFWPFSATRFELPVCHGTKETLYLLQYSTWGHHSLAFYRHGELIEFTYSDWALFALNKRDALTSITHMLFPTLGTLGRKAVPWVPDQTIPPLFVDCIEAVAFEADAQKAAQLFDELEASFKQGQNEEILNEDEGVYFVPYPQRSYWVAHNCNHALAEWLEQLGGNVSGRVFFHPDFIAGRQQP